MFWGLIMEPGRCYTQTVKNAFHVSMAALDISNSSDEPSQVMCVYDGRNYLLCTLNKKNQLQCPLDLNFEVGTKVSFATNGKAHVHLSGYLTEMDDFGDLEEEEEEETELEDSKSSGQKLKRSKSEANGPPQKKSKKEIKLNSSKESLGEEEDSEDDSDFDISKMIGHEESEDEDDEVDEEAEDEEENEAVDEDVSSLSDDEVEEEEVEEEVKPKIKPKQNGVAKKTPIKQQQQQKEKPQKQTKGEKKEKNQTQKQSNRLTLKGGVIVEELREGSGDAAKPGKHVQVYYEGRLKENNKMFDSATKGAGFRFQLGKGEVIKGWDTGLIGMKVGGKRRITCPPGAAYGPKGSPPVIPGNATLVFDVELKKIN